MTARQKIAAARTRLVLDQPFFGVLALRLDVIEDTSRPTAWTDGKTIGYNPTFIDSLTYDEILGLLAHEVLHCANGHPWRRDGRDQKRFNIAADYAINHVLSEAGFRLPEGALRSAQYDGKSAEWIYARLPQDGGGKPGKGKGQGAGQSCEPQPGTGAEDVQDAPTEADAAATEADWRQAVQQAAQAAKARGSLPAALARFAAAAVQPRIDWRSVLRRFVQQAARADYTWRMPNVRYLGRGLYIPSLRSEQMGPVAVAIDTSGSIDQVTLDQFAAELRGVVDEAQPLRTHVLYCDAKVHRIDTFEAGEPVELKPVGGGGTDFRPVMDAVDAMEEPPVCVIYLTDLQGAHRAAPPAMPVLWATTRPGQTPYGEVMEIQ